MLMHLLLDGGSQREFLVWNAETQGCGAPPVSVTSMRVFFSLTSGELFLSPCLTSVRCLSPQVRAKAHLLQLPPKSDGTKNGTDYDSGAAFQGGRCRTPIVKIKIEESERAAVGLTNLRPRQNAAFEVSRYRWNVSAQHNVMKAKAVRFYGIDWLTDEIKIVQPSDVDSGINGGVGSDTVTRVRFNQPDDAIARIALDFNLTDTDISDSTQEVVA